MTSGIPAAIEQETGAKSIWVEPKVNRIDVGDAEGADSVGTDGGLVS